MRECPQIEATTAETKTKNQMQLMKNSTSAEMPKTLTEARNLAAATLANGLVHSVNILTSFGEVVVFRDGTIKLWEDCPELH